MDRLKTSKFLRFLCHILIPIIVLMMGLSIFHISFLAEFGISENCEEYIQSKTFTNRYYNFVINKIYLEQPKRNYVLVQEGDINVYYVEGYYNSFDEWEANINYIVKDKEKNVIYTNIKSEDYQKEINNIINSPIYWNFVNGKVETNLENINEKNLKYRYSYVENEDLINQYEIYSTFDEKKAELSNFAIIKQAYEFATGHKILPFNIFFITGILLILIVIYLIWSIGYEKDKDGITLNFIDRIPYEILSIICLGIVAIFLIIMVNVLNILNYLTIIISLFAYFLGYILCAIWGISTIKRIKAKSFFKSFLVYKILYWLYNKIRGFVNEITNKTQGKKRIFWNYWGFIFVSILLVCTIFTGIGLILLAVFWIWTFYKLLQYARQEEEIKQALKDIYAGKQNVSINQEDLDENLKQMAIYVNDIAGGFSNAIEQSLKSERLKTELITNVSHDIKTPLTSIINYVDLLKKENIQSEKAKEYIEILDKKSQRLKRLTEDLVEASKVSSGNITINQEIIDMKELINQAIGEFKDKFEARGLNIEIDFSSDFKIKADSRYMYRIVENLFSNISKYALDNSRVYIDMKEQDGKVQIRFKNISKEKLNISADELMQRFVRGDKSRFTEGSGLGLSIAQSLCELQNGSFEIFIDGDLFKVVMSFEIYF